MPTGLLIWQPILDHQPHGQGDDTMSVMDFGQRIVGGIGGEIFTTLRAVMLRVSEMDVAGPTRNQIANVVQNSGDDVIAPTTLVTTRAWVMLVVSATQDNLELRQILRTGNALRRIWQ